MFYAEVYVLFVFGSNALEFQIGIRDVYSLPFLENAPFDDFCLYAVGRNTFDSQNQISVVDIYQLAGVYAVQVTLIIEWYCFRSLGIRIIA